MLAKKGGVYWRGELVERACSCRPEVSRFLASDRALLLSPLLIGAAGCLTLGNMCNTMRKTCFFTAVDAVESACCSFLALPARRGRYSSCRYSCRRHRTFSCAMFVLLVFFMLCNTKAESHLLDRGRPLHLNRPLLALKRTIAGSILAI